MILKNRYNYKAKVLNVVDGDTIDVELDLGFDVWVKTRLRIHGIDTPEKRYKAGKEVKQYVINMFRLSFEMDKKGKLIGNIIYCNILGKGKFGRWLADIELRWGKYPDRAKLPISYNLVLLTKGYAKKYTGGKKEKWTKAELDKVAKICGEENSHYA